VFHLPLLDSTCKMPVGPTAKMAVLRCNSFCSPSVLPDKLQAMQVFAPAKINLSLKILSRRSDGFHEIETLIAPITHCDEIKIDRYDAKEGIEFRCDDASVPQGDDNLAVRAAKTFLEAAKLKSGVAIELKKKIPHGAGLGGGSSDAATTLVALNELFKTNLPREALAKMGETIGSDVPFFIFESAAICRGRGELVTPIRLPEKLSILLLKPAFAAPTEWAYSRWQNSREIPGVNYGAQEFSNQTFTNHLERPAFEKFVFLAQLKMWLLRQPEVGVALMSGSGSTMFGVMRPKTDVDLVAKRARQELDPELWTCACETVGGSTAPSGDAN
jgi:4-diphosphocytidyl-2-C-methyl-D-erythritol kinase